MVHDLVISGNASTGGGTFGKVKITGDAVIDGEVRCDSFRCMGSARLTGAIRSAAILKVMGTVSSEESITADEVRVQGQCDFRGDSAVRTLKLGGQLDIREGSLTLEKAEVKGSLTVSGDCQAESFTLKGLFTIGGLLNAGTLNLRLHDECKAKEIGGEQITVKKGSRLDFLHYAFASSAHARLNADVIEGDSIHLENTTARIVRGKNVTIGTGCDIERVECSGTYVQAKDAKVGTLG